MVPGYLCPFPTSGAGRRDAVSKPDVKRETFCTAPLQREVTRIRHMTWHMVIHGSIYTSNPPWPLQRALTGSWRKCHMFLNVSQQIFKTFELEPSKKLDCHMVFHGCHLWQFDQHRLNKDSMHLLQMGGRNTGSQRNSPWLKGVAQKSNYQLSTPHLDHVQSFTSKIKLKGSAMVRTRWDPKKIQKVSTCKHKRSHLHQAWNEFPHLQWTFPAKQLHWQVRRIIGS